MHTIAIAAHGATRDKSSIMPMLRTSSADALTELLAATLTANGLSSLAIEGDDVIEVYGKGFELDLKHLRASGPSSVTSIKLELLPDNQRKTVELRNAVFVASVKIAVTLSRFFGVPVEIRSVPHWT